MKSVKIKFCGITNFQDASDAVEAGADMLGFNFYRKSPRFIEPAECLNIIKGLRAQSPIRSVKVITVGVFVNESRATVLETLTRCQLDLAQLSGDETREFVSELGDKAIKVIRATQNRSFTQTAQQFPRRQSPPGFVLDASVNGQYGGTGRTADWEQAAEIASMMPVLLAGGLHPGNVLRAVEQIKPWGVDVASGIESSPGRKDFLLMNKFVAEVRRYEQMKMEKNL